MKLIYGSDWHTRYSNPICRTDNYAETIKRKGLWLKELAKEYDAPILNGGDLTDKALYKAPQGIIQTINILINYWPDMIGIIGNHDILHRAYQYLDKSIISIMTNFGRMQHIKDVTILSDKNNEDDCVAIHGFSYGTGGIKHPEELHDGINIAMMHEYVSKKKNNLFGEYVGIDLLKEFPEFDFILTGDNHATFTEEYEGRVLINPGSFLRMDADQKDHKPCVWLIDTKTKEYSPIYVPIEDNVISDEHIQIEKERGERIDKFVIAMDQEYEITDLFEKNVEEYILKNKKDKDGNILINKNVEKYINMSIEGNL